MKDQSTLISQEILSHLEIIYQYYSRLNNKRNKFKMFEEVQDKISLMNLHEFMIFCKRFKLTQKHHKHQKHQNPDHIPNEQTQSSQKVIKILSSINDNNDEQMPEQGQKVLYQEKRNENNEIVWIQQQKNKKQQPNMIERQQPKIVKENIQPQSFLNESSLAKIFKKKDTKQGQISFLSFIDVLKAISVLMYSGQHILKEKGKNKVNKRQQNDQSEESFLRLLKFMHLDSKQHIKQTYIQINQQDGNKFHLSMLRSPIKKIHLKNDPLNKHTQLIHAQSSDLVHLHNLSKSQQRKVERLPIINNTRNIKQLNHNLKNKYLKQSNAQNRIQKFLKSNQSQIFHLNKGLSEKSKPHVQLSANHESFQLPQPTQMALKNSQLSHCSHAAQKTTKKYSQRHKVKILGDCTNRQIGRLIDVEYLYQDDIFNKYLQLNYKKQQHNKDSKY